MAKVQSQNDGLRFTSIHWALVFWLLSFQIASAARPNILWFIVDDMSPNFSCYGEKSIQTPHVDRLAAEGTRFTNAYVTAPVCSPCRSALITGMYQTSIGAHHHRSGRGEMKINLPSDVTPIPVLFQKAGYYTCIGNGLVSQNNQSTGRAARNQLGKTDYNFEWENSMYDSPDWSGRQAGQPFFMQVQLAGGKLRGDSDATVKKLADKAAAEFGGAVKPDAVTLPPYYPRDPVLLRDWAGYLDAVRFTDDHVGKVIARLRQEGILDETLIIFMTDHGISHARGKQFLYDEGTHVPLVVRGPNVPKGVVRQDLVEHIDLAAISLAAAGIEIPDGSSPDGKKGLAMQGKNLFASDYQTRDTVFAARDRCDETVERLRSIRTKDYLYIRNFYPARPHLQPNAYKDHKSILIALRGLHSSGSLDPLIVRLLFSPTRPVEELYKWNEDPYQLTNLASDVAHASALKSLRERLDRWILETNDHGPESDAMYDSDMKVYLGKGNPEVEKNIAQMKLWAKENR